MAIGTLIAIILAVFILIALLFFWNQQTGIFSDFLRNIAGKTNVDSVVTICNTLESQNAIHDYCCVEKNVRYEQEKKIQEEKLTCNELREKEISGDRIKELNCNSTVC